MLRRLKSDVELVIPPKKEIIVFCPLTKLQQTFYKATLNNTIENLLDKKVFFSLFIYIRPKVNCYYYEGNWIISDNYKDLLSYPIYRDMFCVAKILALLVTNAKNQFYSVFVQVLYKV